MTRDPGSGRDPVSGALPRSAFEAAFARAGQARGVALVLVDLDHLKSINDAFGHTRGDEALREFAARAGDLLPAGGHLYRLGGDEFAAVFPDPEEQCGRRYVEELLHAIAGRPFSGVPELHLTASVGAAWSPRDGTPATGLLECADRRLREAKRLGRARGVTGSEDLAPGKTTDDRLLERDGALEALHGFLDEVPRKPRSGLLVEGPPGSGKSRFLREAVLAARMRGYRTYAYSGRAGAHAGEAVPLQHSLNQDLGPVQDGAAPALIVIDEAGDLPGQAKQLLDGALLREHPAPLGVVLSGAPGAVRPPRSLAAVQRVALAPFGAVSLRAWVRGRYGLECRDRFIRWLLDRTGGLPGALDRELNRLIQDGRLARSAAGWTLAPGFESSIGPGARPAGRDIPAPLTRLHGRQADLDAIESLLKHTRLLTLLGPSGIGKTRLALHAAEILSPSQGDGCFVVSLAPLTDPAQVLPTLAAALGIPDSGSDQPAEAIRRFLSDRDCLLVLDNFEHVLAAAPTLGEILRAAPRVRALVTSRIALRIYGESEYAVPPLATPAAGREIPVERLTEFPAVALFLDRARAVRPRLDLTPENAPLIGQICRSLDGLPLALELAAGQLRILSLEQVVERLPRRIGLLVGGPRDLPARQRSFREALDWSVGLLDEPESAMFRRLSVFSGEFDLEAADAVAGSPGVPVDSGALPVLAALRDQSLVYSCGPGRFVLLETIREYALEKLAAAGEEQEARVRHRTYFVRLADAAEAGLQGAGQREFLVRLDRAYHDIRAVLADLASAAATGGAEQEAGLRLAASMWRYWTTRGMITEAVHWLDRFLNLSAGEPVARGTALRARGIVALFQGDTSRAGTCLKESLDLARGSGDREGEAHSLHNLSNVHHLEGDLTAAEAALRKALAIRHELGVAGPLASTLHNLGGVLQEQGRLDEAIRFHSQALEIWDGTGDSLHIALGKCDLAILEQERGNTGEALALFGDALGRWSRIEYRPGALVIVDRLAIHALESGDAATAVTLWGWTDARRRDMGIPPRGESGTSGRAAVRQRAAMGAALYDPLCERAADLTWEEAMTTCWRILRGSG